jgi:hypothetical protein
LLEGATGSEVPVEIMGELDRKIADRSAATGGFRGSQHLGGGVVSPSAGMQP